MIDRNLNDGVFREPRRRKYEGAQKNSLGSVCGGVGRRACHSRIEEDVFLHVTGLSTYCAYESDSITKPSDGAMGVEGYLITSPTKIKLLNFYLSSSPHSFFFFLSLRNPSTHSFPLFFSSLTLHLFS